MAKTDKVKEVKEETPSTFTYRHVVKSYTPMVRFRSVCPKCNN